MNARDEAVLHFLNQHGGFLSTQVHHLREWWLATRKGEELLVDFLVRLDLLRAPTVRRIQQLAVHDMTAPANVQVDRDELDRFRCRLPEVAILDRERGIPHTVAILGDDTARDDTSGDAPPVYAEPPHVGGYLGRYLLTDWVGDGSTGQVFRALHPTLLIPVAVKVLRTVQFSPAADRLANLQAEARVLAQLNHPNIVRVYDFEHDPHYPFLVLEYVNGPNLAELIEHCGRIQSCRATRILRQLVDGLCAAHASKVVHRDIKPANILLTRNGEAKLADLGLAQSGLGAKTGRGLMAESARVGTVSYMAPELADSNRIADERSDIYSLGATLFHALVGEPPFVGDSPWKVMAGHAKTPVPSLRMKVADVPPALEKLVVAMLAKRPEDRPQSFAELLHHAALHAGMASRVANESESSPERAQFWRRVIQRIRDRKPVATGS